MWAVPRMADNWTLPKMSGRLNLPCQSFAFLEIVPSAPIAMGITATFVAPWTLLISSPRSWYTLSHKERDGSCILLLLLLLLLCRSLKSCSFHLWCRVQSMSLGQSKVCWITWWIESSLVCEQFQGGRSSVALLFWCCLGSFRCSFLFPSWRAQELQWSLGQLLFSYPMLFRFLSQDLCTSRAFLLLSRRCSFLWG